MLFGVGLTGNALLDLLLNEKIFQITDIFVADRDEKAFSHFYACGGAPENRFLFHMERGNCTEPLLHLTAGDFFVCLAEGIDYCMLLENCLQRGIHFICAADDCFEGENDKVFLHEQAHLEQAAALRRQYGKAATSILQFGCNPGLVSIFVKKALKEIVCKDQGPFVSQHREAMIRLLQHGEYSALAECLGLRRVIEIDLDTTRTDIEEDPHTLYSTWNTKDFENEMNRHALFKLGTEDSLPDWLNLLQLQKDRLLDSGRTDGAVILERPGKETCITGKGPEGSFRCFRACVVPHEELFSLYEYLSLRSPDQELLYAPTVMFLYQPCPLAFSSLFHEENRRHERIVNNRVKSGGETVGVMLEGKNFSPRFVYTELRAVPTAFATPTVYQVAASLFCAVKYILRHPKEGVLLPENLDTEEVLLDISGLLPMVSQEGQIVFSPCAEKNFDQKRGSGCD